MKQANQLILPSYKRQIQNLNFTNLYLWYYNPKYQLLNFKFIFLCILSDIFDTKYTTFKPKLTLNLIGSVCSSLHSSLAC